MSKTENYWSYRGFIPHYHSKDDIQSITIRLADSLPRHVIKRLLLGERVETDIEYYIRLEDYLDAGYGSSILKESICAERLQTSLLNCHNERYHLHCWTIMPNHAHVLVKFMPGINMGDEIKAWKASVSREVKKQTGKGGQIWFEDYWDRYMRNEKHYFNSVAYIENNPVKAGLVKEAGDWKYGSSGYGFKREMTD